MQILRTLATSKVQALRVRKHLVNVLQNPRGFSLVNMPSLIYIFNQLGQIVKSILEREGVLATLEIRQESDYVRIGLPAETYQQCQRENLLVKQH